MKHFLPVLACISFYAVSMTGNRKGVAFFISGLLMHSGYIIYRGMFLGRLPVTERHDILLVIAMAVAACFFYFRKRVHQNMVLDVLPLFVITFSFFAVFQEKVDTIEPNMNSRWFYLYSLFFVLGYSLFCAGSAAGIFCLKEGSLLHETMQYRLILFGWLFFSFSLIGGSVWFYLAYGSYWLWTAKELWVTIVWFYYSFYLHGRMVRSLSGRPAVIFGAAGFPVMMFSYLGVTPLLGSPWTQF